MKISSIRMFVEDIFYRTKQKPLSNSPALQLLLYKTCCNVDKEVKTKKRINFRLYNVGKANVIHVYFTIYTAVLLQSDF